MVKFIVSKQDPWVDKTLFRDRPHSCKWWHGTHISFAFFSHCFDAIPLSEEFIITSRKLGIPGLVTPRMKGWSLPSMLESSKVAASASVLATRMRFVFKISAASLAATNLSTCSRFHNSRIYKSESEVEIGWP